MTTTTKPILIMDKIYSHIATDSDDKRYYRWGINHHARQEKPECVVCGKALDAGWHCIDSGGSHCDSDLYCDDCIIDSERPESIQ